MGDLTVKITGLDRLLAKIEAIPPAIREAQLEANKANAREFMAGVARIVPVGQEPDKTGAHLVSTLEMVDGRTPTSVKVTIGGPEAPYPAFLEYGHMDHGKHVPAEPFWWTTWRVMKKRFRARSARAANAAFKRFAADGGS